MNQQKFTRSTNKNIEEEINNYIRLKKEENQALKKLLSALENAKKANDSPVRS